MLMMSRRFVASASLAALLALPACGELALNASATDEWTRTYPLSDGGEVSIENANGRVEVDAGDPGTVEVHAERIAKGSTDEAAKQLLPRITINEDVRPDRVAISTAKMSGVMIGASFEVRYRVRAPKNAALKIGNTNGGIRVSGISGPIEAHGTNGAVNGRDLGGAVDASIVNGGVTVDMAAVGSQRIILNATNGGVTLSVPDDAKSDVDASVVNGGIAVTGVKIEVVEQTRRHLQGRMNGGGGASIELKTINGGVRIRSRATGVPGATGGVDAGEAGKAGERR